MSSFEEEQLRLLRRIANRQIGWNPLTKWLLLIGLISIAFGVLCMQFAIWEQRHPSKPAKPFHWTGPQHKQLVSQK